MNLTIFCPLDILKNSHTLRRQIPQKFQRGSTMQIKH
jgi:hypothetical protein